MLTRKLYLIGRAASSRRPPPACWSWLRWARHPAGQSPSSRVETLQSVAALPPHLVGRFGEPAGFQQAAEGDYFVVDRRGHTVSRIDAAMTAITPLLAIGHEARPGPAAVRVRPRRRGVCRRRRAAAPPSACRCSRPSGSRVSAFTLSTPIEAARATRRPGPQRRQRDAPDGQRTVLLNQPDTGRSRQRVRHQGPRAPERGHAASTAHDGDAQLAPGVQRRACRCRFPAAASTSSSRPASRASASTRATGALVFERAIQGRELDALVADRSRRRGRGVRASRRGHPGRPAAGPGGHGRPTRAVVDQLHRAVHLRVRRRRREGARRPVSRRWRLAPTSLFFARDGRLLVTPGCYIFRPSVRSP